MLMNILQKITVATVIVGTGFLAGCNSSSSSSSAYTAPTRAAALAAQTAVITITDPAGTPSVSVDTQPANITLAATVTSPGTGGAGTIDVALSATNNAGRIISNMKVDIGATSTLSGNTISNSSGTLPSGDEYISFGPKAVADGATRDAADLLSFNTGGSTGNITLNVTLPTQDFSLWTTDSTSSTAIQDIDTGAQTQDYNVDVQGIGGHDYQASLRWGASSPDGHYLFMGHKQQPVIVVLDTTTLAYSTVAMLENNGTLGATDAVAMSPDAHYLYASVLEGDHNYRDGSSNGYHTSLNIRNWLVKVDRTTMEVVSRLELTPANSGARLRRLSISSDGSTGALAVDWSGDVDVINLNNMTLTKSVNVTGDCGARPRYAAIAPDASKVYVACNDTDSTDLPNPDGAITVIDLSDYSMSSITPTTATGTNYVSDLQFGPDGRLYYARDGGQYLSIFDVSTTPPTEKEIPNADVVSRCRAGISFSPYGDYYYCLNNSSDLQVFKMSDDSLFDSYNVGTRGYHMLIPTSY